MMSTVPEDRRPLSAAGQRALEELSAIMLRLLLLARQDAEQGTPHRNAGQEPTGPRLLCEGGS